MEMRTDARTRGEFTSPKLGACQPVDAAIPRTEIAVGEHPEAKFAENFKQARPLPRRRHPRTGPDRLPPAEKNWRKPVEFAQGPVLPASRKFNQRADDRAM